MGFTADGFGWISMTTMKSLVLLSLLCVAFLCGCDTVLYDRHTGKPLARWRSDITNGDYRDGPTRFRWDTMDNSAPTTAAFAGVARVTDSAVNVAGLMTGKVVPAVASSAANISSNVFHQQVIKQQMEQSRALRQSMGRP